MVGFKSIALLISLLLFAACVPQTKQTECSSNEAFSAALRTCVPVVNGPSSFINIDSFLPTTSLTKYKNDTTAMTFSVVIDNPYAQTYTVEWERIFNGVPVPITPNTETSYSFAPTFLATQVGIHTISVKVRDTSNKIVDSHNFQLVINENPRPVIQSATVTPAPYASSYTPTQVPQNFQFTIFNNSAITLGAGYRTDWKLYRSGLLIDSETDVFTSTTTGGYNYPSYAFDPVLIDSVAVGAYTIIARVTNTAAEVVAEQQWSATVAHPPLSRVKNRDIYSSTTSPSFSAITTAYDSVAYTASTTLNFIPAGGVAQGDYCVRVASGDGTYTLDGLFVRVDYYLDGGTSIYSGTTTAIDPKICLTDAAAATLNGVIFSNTSSTTTQTHTLVARVTDEATGFEYALSDMDSSLGSYPITWNFSVKPQNKAPTIAFGTPITIPLSCTTTTASSKSGCTVVSDTDFKVNIKLASDDFYFPVTVLNEANLDYSIRLYEDNVNIQTCTKTDPDYNGSIDMDGTVGGNGYDCTFHIESYNSSGSFDTKAKIYTIQAEISDNGSPVSSTAATSSTFSWNFALGAVAEKRTAPTVTLFTASNATEGSAITFSATIDDPERDNHTYTIQYCQDAGCASPLSLGSGPITRASSASVYNFSQSYTLSEDFLLGISALGCNALVRGGTCDVTFKLKVDDLLNSTGTVPAASASVTLNVAVPPTITNYNPPVVMNTAVSSPIPSAVTALTTFAFVGHPFTIINPSTFITDTSIPTTEKTYRYQWFVKNNTSSPFPISWTEIEGATGVNLVWTPSLINDANIATDNPISLRICVEDQPVLAIPTVNIVDSICSSSVTPWTLTVVNNIATAHDISSAPSSTELAALSTEYGNETAIWYETPTTANSVTSSASYVATIGNDQRIHVKKVLVRKEGAIDTTSSSSIVSFAAFPSASTYAIKDLSITGYENAGVAEDLYIAYLASSPGSPLSFYPQVRRIDLKSGGNLKTVPNNHFGRFGFDYDGLGVTNSCTPSTDCPTTTASAVTTLLFANSGFTTGQLDLLTPTGTFSILFGISNGINTVCSICSPTIVAGQVATIINASTDAKLAGYSALAVGTAVNIYGATTTDYINATTLVSISRVADRMGKIYVHGTKWYLPFIDTTLGGSFNDKISAYTDNVGALSSATVTIKDSTTGTTGLNDMDATVKFDNYYDGTNLWVAMISKTASVGKLYKLDPALSSAVTISNTALFSSEALIDVQLGSSSSYVYVAAKKYLTVSTYKNRLGIYDLNAVMDEEFDINLPANLPTGADITDDIFNHTSISSLRILPYGTEARLFAASKGSGSYYKLYMARLSLVGSTWTLSCGDCQPVSELGDLVTPANNVGPYVSLGVAPIRDNPSSLYRLSTDGATAAANQGIKDVAFVSFGRSRTMAGTTFDPAIGVFNVEGEAINSATIYNGANPNEDAGLFRPPFIKN